MGSYVVDANRHVGVGTFFLAKNVRQIAESAHDDLEEFEICWVPSKELKKVLFDGRVGIFSYATNIAVGLAALDSKGSY